MTRQEFSDRLVALVTEAIAAGVTRTDIVAEFELHADELDEPAPKFLHPATRHPFR